MGNPPSHLDFKHTCPTCNRPVRHGDKFCEICGTRIPSLSTCSKCGTQFIHPKKFCDLCGAPFILEEVPEPDEEELPETTEEETPKQYDNKIQEPDTDELLKHYGGEYDDDATLNSYHKVKPTSPIQPKTKKSVTVPAPPGRGSPEAVDDALFLLDEGPTPAKSPVNKRMIIGAGIGLITILTVIFFIGLPILTDSSGFNANSNPASAEITPLPAFVTLTVKPATASSALVPQPTEMIPTEHKIFFQVQKNPITSKISVIFTGPAGAGSISSADVKVTHADGSVTMGVILPLKGVSEITLAGSKEPDRVEIIAKMSTGETYRVFDDLVPFIR